MSDTLYGVMTLFQTDFDQVPGGAARLPYLKSWVDKAADIGSQVIRIPGDWVQLEPGSKGNYAQWYVEETVELIKYAGEQGMSVIFEVGQTPDWAKPAGEDFGHFTPPADPDDYADAVAYLHQKLIDGGASQYVSAWEIWNEPNVSTFWPGSNFRNPVSGDQSIDPALNQAAALEYVALLNAAYDALKAVDSSVTVLGGSLAGTDFEYAEWMLQAGAKFDGLAVHPYTRPYNPSSPTPAGPSQDPTQSAEESGLSNTLNERWSFEYGIEALHDLLVAYGQGSKGIWLTEMGWRVYDSDTSWSYVPDQATQAAYLSDALDLIANWDFIDAVTVFQLYDSGDGDFGLLNPDGTWRPSAQTLHDHIQHEAGEYNVINGTSGNDIIHGVDGKNEINGLDGDDIIYGFNNDDRLSGGAGNDEIHPSYGSNLVDGGAGTDTVVIDGRQTDFTIGVSGVTVQVGGDGVWNLIENVEFIHFDAPNNETDTTVDVSDLLGGLNEIVGTSGDDYLVGTASADIIRGGDGNDTLYGRGGDDILKGEGGTYNQADYDGVVTDYTFVRNGDGTITVSHLTDGSDTLSDINGFWFYGDDQWYSADQLAPQPGGETVSIGTGNGNYYGGTDYDDTINFTGGTGNYVNGGSGNDTIVFSGSITNYTILGEGEHFTITNSLDGSTVQFASVEDIKFADSNVLSLADIVAAADHVPGEYWYEPEPIGGLV